MLLNDGIVVEKDGEKSVLKEFEVLPQTAMTAIQAVSGTDGDIAKINANIIVARIRIKGLPAVAWNLNTLSQMSAADWLVMQTEMNAFDENFTFAPPILKI